MRWTLINGSPRGRRSNTLILLQRMAQGLADAGHSTELLSIALPSERALVVERWTQAERLLLGFPLYADAMPGQVMELFEELEGTCARPNPAPIAFLVHSGFPEPGQSRAIERWLGLFAKRLGARHIATIVKGGLFDLQTLPARKAREILQRFEELGRQLGANDRLEPKVLRKLCGPDWFPRWLRPVVRLILRLSDDGNWNRKLKANGAFAHRFDQPYVRQVGQARGDSAGSKSREETPASL